MVNDKIAHSVTNVHTYIGTSVMCPSVDVCVGTILVPGLGVIIVHVVNTYIFEKILPQRLGRWFIF